MLARYAWFILGVVINSFGISFITKAALGTSPITSVPYVLSMELPLTLGQLSFILNMLFILLQIILLRRGFQWYQLLQIGVNIIFSLTIDLSMQLLTFFNPTFYPFKLLSLLVGCAILALGICIEVAPNVLMVPGEGAVKAIAQVSRKEFGLVKVCFDVTLMLTAVLLSFLFFHQLQGIREGTIISACLVGRIVRFYHHRLPFLKQIANLAPKPVAVKQAQSSSRQTKENNAAS